jgi:RNA polymerase sigma-70 factor (ECF subfamily)
MDNYVINNYTDDQGTAGMDELDPEQKKLMISRAMEHLTDDENLLITLFYKGENSIEEISNITGLSMSNVKVRLHRIRKKLYDELAVMMEKAMNQLN